MQINEALIKHYREEIVPIEKLKTLVDINEAYLREKPTWYNLDKGNLVYFKSRNDLRLFSELFFAEFARNIIGLDTIDFDTVFMRTINHLVKPNDEERKIGLISQNFQVPKNNYYLVSELENSEVSSLVAYGEYSLINLLRFFKDLLSKENYEIIKNFLIRLFIADAFTLQADRNHNNISFQIAKINGVDYTQRLRPNVLQKMKNTNGVITMEESMPKIIGLEPSKVYDSERILGIDHKNQFIHTMGDVWMPLFAYSPDLKFSDQAQAQEAKSVYDDCDPNLLELITNFPEVKDVAERLAYGDEYREILEKYRGTSKPVALNDNEYSQISDTIEERRIEFQKVLKL